LFNCATSGIFGSIACLADSTASSISKANLLGSAAGKDAVNLGIEDAKLLPSLGKCTADGVTSSSTQFAALAASEISCILKG
ncbi:hypothetical protein L9F63_005929, partial [Diploptera punctata]